MKQGKQYLALLLLGAMLLSACSGADDKETDTAETVTAEGGVTTETGIIPDIPDVTFENEEFRIMYRYGSHAYNIEDIWVEGMNGEIINDTVYERNNTVEDKFGIKIFQLPEVSTV